MGPELIWQTSNLQNMNILLNNIRIHSYLVVDINNKKNSKYG